MSGKKKPKILQHHGLGVLPAGSLVWAYLRHSPGEDQTIHSQRLAVEEFCRQRALTVARWWIDEARSGGTTESRDAFEGMMLASRQQPAAVAGIVVWDLSRLSRDILEPQFYLADLRLRGYKVLSIKDDVPEGEFATVFESLILWKNHRYLTDLSANVHRGLDATVNARVQLNGHVMTGFSGGGPAPVGYQAARVQVGVKKSGKPQELVYWVKTEDPDVRARVERAWQMALELARAGKHVEVGRIHAECRVHKNLSHYYHFFRSPTYKGSRKVGERIVDGAHEGYVTPEEWALVQAHMRSGRPSPLVRHPRRVNSPFFLSGRVFCGYCGSRIDYEHDYRTASYTALRCAGRKRDHASCELSKLSYQAFMEELLGLIFREVLTEERVQSSIEEVNRRMAGSRDRIAEERRRLVREVAAVSRTIERLVDAIEAGTPVHAVQGRLLEREKEKAELEGRLADLAHEARTSQPVTIGPAALRLILERLREDLSSGEPESVREVLQGLVKRVTVWNEKARVEFSLPPAPVLQVSPNFRAMLWRARGDSNPRSPA